MQGGDKESGKRRKGQQRGGLKVHRRQERREKEEVQRDVIIRLRSKRCISSISVWKSKLSWQEKRPNLLLVIG